MGSAVSRRFRVLLSDPLSADARRILLDSGQIEVIEEHKGLEKHLAGIDGWILRSGTRITHQFLEQAPRLTCICRAGAGVDNVDLDAATRRGVVVMNTPDSNSMAAAEHAVALLLTLARQIPFAHLSMAQGGWERGVFVGVEVEGKSAGIVGLGRVGRIVARKLQGLGMKVLGVDPFITAAAAADHGIQLTTLAEMLPLVDFITLHVPLGTGTRGLIGAAELERAKPGLRIVNSSRGGVVDERALLAALEKGRVAGAALDVFATEPLPKDSPLRKHPRIVVTPHLGASTVEAQEQVATVSAIQVRDFLLEGTIANAVNAVSLAGEQRRKFGALATLARRLGSLHAQLLEGEPRSFEVELEEQLIDEGVDRLLVDSALAGFLATASEGVVNTVNARLRATERGITVQIKGRSRGSVYTNAIRIDVVAAGGRRSLEGAVIWEDLLRLVRFEGYVVEGELAGPMLITGSVDRPGMIGKLGRMLGELGYNIANMSLGRMKKGGDAIAIFNLDEPVRRADLDVIGAIEGVQWVRPVSVEADSRAAPPAA